MEYSGYYLIVNKKSDRCLDVDHARTENGTKIIQHSLHGEDNQLWEFVSTEDGYYEIVSKHSGSCLDDGNSSKVNKGPIHQWTRHKGDNQKWKVVSAKNGYYLIVSKIGGLCIDGKEESYEGAGIHLWEIYESETQLWRFIKLEDVESFKEEIKTKKERQLSKTVADLSTVNLPTQLIENIDVNSIAKRMGELFTELKDLSNLKDERERAGFFKKFWWAISGKTTDAVVNALDTQGELLKIQSMLMVLNTMFAKELNKQQKFLTSQQENIITQNDRIEAHQCDIDRHANDIDNQQKTLLKLINLTNEQEQKIRDVVQQAEYIKDMEKRIDTELKKISNLIPEELSSMKREFIKQLEDTKSNSRQELQNVNQFLLNKINNDLVKENEARIRSENELESKFTSSISSEVQKIKRKFKVINYIGIATLILVTILIALMSFKIYNG